MSEGGTVPSSSTWAAGHDRWDEENTLSAGYTSVHNGGLVAAVFLGKDE